MFDFVKHCTYNVTPAHQELCDEVFADPDAFIWETVALHGYMYQCNGRGDNETCTCVLCICRAANAPRCRARRAARSADKLVKFDNAADEINFLLYYRQLLHTFP